MDDGGGPGKKRPIEPRFHFVVIRDDQLQTQLNGHFSFRETGDAAIDADDQRDFGADKFAEFFRIETVAFREPEWSVKLNGSAKFAE